MILIERMSMEKLREVRKELGLTQYQAAEIIGISHRTYQTYEEKKRRNEKADALIIKLRERIANGCKPQILSKRFIKQVSREVFAKHQEVECAYLFGSYARNEATPSSDLDFMIVAPKLEGFAFSGLHHELREALGKEVDLINHTTLEKSDKMLRDILIQGVKVYGQRIIKSPD